MPQDRNSPVLVAQDYTLLVSDQVLTAILSNLTKSQQLSSCLVCKSACIISPRNSGICLSNKFVSIHVHSFISDNECVWKPDFLSIREVDRGVRILAESCPNLRRLVLCGVSLEGLASVANECLALQELELCSCTDLHLKGLVGFRNLQILKLIGSVNGLYAGADPHRVDRGPRTPIFF
ncbi:putative leucine-rich repeat domain superfamily [Helianthus debilis subsp. tardiflorus]